MRDNVLASGKAPVQVKGGFSGTGQETVVVSVEGQEFLKVIF